MAKNRKATTVIKLFWTSMVLVFLMGGVLALFWNKLPPQLPWLYSFPWGERQLIYKMWFVWIFLGTGGFLVLTRSIANWAGREDPQVQTTLMIGGFLAVVMMAASFTRIMMIFLNI